MRYFSLGDQRTFSHKLDPLRSYDAVQSGQSAESAFSELEHHKADVGGLTQSATSGHPSWSLVSRSNGKMPAESRHSPALVGSEECKTPMC